MNSTARWFGLAWLALAAGASPTAAQECQHPTGELPFVLAGDLRATGVVNVADALCCVQVALRWPQITAGEAPPACLAEPLARADLNCDDTVDIADVTVVIHLATQGQYPPELDPEARHCPTTCTYIPAAPSCPDGTCDLPDGACGACQTPCGGGHTVSHAGYIPGVSPADDPAFTGVFSYGTASGDDFPALGAGNCWTTMNLGAMAAPTGWSDSSAEAAGWYFQFNRPQAHVHVGGGRIPDEPWESPLEGNPTADWLHDDPCTLALGAPWRLPTRPEWQAFWNAPEADGGLNGWGEGANAFTSPLAIHGAGYLSHTVGNLQSRGGVSLMWSSTHNPNNVPRSWYLDVSYDEWDDEWYAFINHALWQTGLPVRCIRPAE